ncbi:hypothetical protein A2634_03940 [Candidatus Amesbacteria bacterium RIFCSPHIGHO2_01_FULL_48_32]|uniref:Polysaccharide biosynthesis protein C-terminal domain-containing protein n=1 Tax=Candidatus Amesbacteria bacterium RIFCSPLOWO2_01_FULL_48_25 TaxID=1797259 RepID=A0A1F4ZBA7_9BACT|nr:MAG: hypothetical protein A2634_03940 [Candidatus Amesbacteria bacterium RIFCSPHIGHO2_01_FULL_48_32]OGD03505.1 MAG: hypothetical protein A2989_02670 [Candidatus Amesbacteria bacterium RIFCSPLOWO2_01_FULL_48_25]HJZ05815.1 lipopolysaccharide biosynthesis protein [Patescibacteria group bacterium]
MGYFKSVIRGLSWSFTLRFFIRGFTVVRTIVLARILLPAQFGAYGVASLTLAILEVFTETGINVFLIQERKLEPHLNTAWSVSIIRGLVIGAVMFFASPIIATFFRSPSSLILIQLIALVAIVRGFINPSIVKFQKDLQFHKEFIFRGVILAAEAVIAISLAIILRSPISLAISLLISAFFEVVLSLYFILPRPKLIFNKKEIHLIVQRGKWVTAAGIFNYLYHNADNIVVGRMLGVTSLGLYDTAYKISGLPVTELAEVFSKVTFPVFAQIKGDKVRLWQSFIKSTLALSAIVVPFGIFLFFFPQIIVFLLGPNWAPAIPALRLLSIYGVIRSISGFSSALFLAVNKANFVTYVTLASILGLTVSIYPLVSRLGLVGAALSVIIGSLTALPVVIYYTYKIFNNLSS